MSKWKKELLRPDCMYCMKLFATHRPTTWNPPVSQRRQTRDVSFSIRASIIWVLVEYNLGIVNPSTQVIFERLRVLISRSHPYSHLQCRQWTWWRGARPTWSPRPHWCQTLTKKLMCGLDFLWYQGLDKDWVRKLIQRSSTILHRPIFLKKKRKSRQFQFFH